MSTKNTTKRNGNKASAKTSKVSKPSDGSALAAAAVREGAKTQAEAIGASIEALPKNLALVKPEDIQSKDVAAVVDLFNRSREDAGAWTPCLMRRRDKKTGELKDPIVVGHKVGFGKGAARGLKLLGHSNKEVREILQGEAQLRNTLAIGALRWLIEKGWVGEGMKVTKRTANITFKHPNSMPNGEGRRSAGPSKQELRDQLDAQKRHAAMLEAKLSQLTNTVDVESTVTS